MHILVHTPVRVFVQSLHPAAVGACQQRSRSRPQSTSLANMLSRECFPRSPHPVCGWSVCVHIHSEWRHRDAIPTIADYIHLSHAPNTHSIYQAHLHNRAHACPLILLYIIPQPICRLWGSKHLLSLSFLFSPPAQILPAKRIFRPWPLENTWERNYRLNQTWACQYVSGEGGKRNCVPLSSLAVSQSSMDSVWFFFQKKIQVEPGAGVAQRGEKNHDVSNLVDCTCAATRRRTGLNHLSQHLRHWLPARDNQVSGPVP